MKKYLIGVLALGVVGCADTGRNTVAGRGAVPQAVADISPSAPAGYNANGGYYNPNVLNPAQPIQPIQPFNVQPVEPASNNFSGNPPAVTASAQITSGNYTVQKGDTLYKIARERYGDAKQWQRIVAANPGLSPNSIKVGQKIVIP